MNNFIRKFLLDGPWEPLVAPPPYETALNDADDCELIESIRNGSDQQRKDAFNVLYNRCTPPLWTFIRNRAASEAQAKDVFAKTWEVAVKDFTKPTTSSEKTLRDGKPMIAWLYGVAKNHVAKSYEQQARANKLTNKLQKKFSQVLSDDEATINEVELSLDRAARQKLIAAALTRIANPKDRKIIIMRYFYGLKTKVIAQKLGMKPNTVTKRLKRLSNKLRKFIENDD